MARKLPAKDVVIIGLGWTGSILAYELAEAGLERRGDRARSLARHGDGFPPAYAQDELRYAVRLDLFLRPDAGDADDAQQCLPDGAADAQIWQLSFPATASAAPACIGTGRPGASCRPISSSAAISTQRYGKDALPADMTIQDWGVSYDELEPYYDRFEKLCGTSGKAGNIKGQKQAGGNPFEGWRSSEYPTPPLKQAYGADAVRGSGAQDWAFIRFRSRPPISAKPTSIRWACKLGQCTYCGFCERFGCGNYAKSSPQTCVLPALMRFPNFSAHRMRGH